MRILIDPASFTCDNLGDVAMLNVAVARIRALLPGAHVQVLTSDPAALLRHQRDVEPVLQLGRENWAAERYLLGRMHSTVPRTVSRGLIRMRSRLRSDWPRFEHALIRTKLRYSLQDCSTFDEYCEAIRAADAFVVAGAATISDTMPLHSRMVFDAIERALSYDIPVAMFSQAIGPLQTELRARAVTVLPRVQLIALREPFAYEMLVEQCAVNPCRIAVTGDDAVELAYKECTGAPGRGVGVNARCTSYTGLCESALSVLRTVLHRFARAHGCPLIPLPTANHKAAHDSSTLAELLRDCEFAEAIVSPGSPAEAIRQAGSCRIVVTGAYHVAVFALAQGIPAVCVAREPYTLNKFRGLAEQFGAGCTWVDAGGPALLETLTHAIEQAWQSSEVIRSALVQAAQSQIRSGMSVYTRWAAEIRAASRIPALNARDSHLTSAGNP